MSDNLDDLDKELIDIFRKRFEHLEPVIKQEAEEAQDLPREAEEAQDLPQEAEEAQDLLQNLPQEAEEAQDLPQEAQETQQEAEEAQDLQETEEAQDLQETEEAQDLPQEAEEAQETEDLPQEAEETQNLQQEMVKETPSCLEYIFLVILFCFGSFIFYIYFPIKMNFDSHKAWITYTDTCCQAIQNVTRCSIGNKCKRLLDLWIYFQNSTRDYYECCYWYTKYSEWRLFSTPFCDPSCLSPKIF